MTIEKRAFITFRSWVYIIRLQKKPPFTKAGCTNRCSSVTIHNHRADILPSLKNLLDSRSSCSLWTGSLDEDRLRMRGKEERANPYTIIPSATSPEASFLDLSRPFQQLWDPPSWSLFTGYSVSYILCGICMERQPRSSCCKQISFRNKRKQESVRWCRSQIETEPVPHWVQSWIKTCSKQEWKGYCEAWGLFASNHQFGKGFNSRTYISWTTRFVSE